MMTLLSAGALASPWAVLPFVGLLAMIATGPLFYAKFWHHHYPKVAVALALGVVGYYLLALGNAHAPLHAAFEYFQFIALLTALFVASGSIMLEVEHQGTAKANTLLLLVGAVIANLIGTTGASMLLIRPFIRLNKERIRPYHIVFFIFIVSNVGGALTPIGDPPLFLGFLKGIPFGWTLMNNLPVWAFAISILLAVFYAVDQRAQRKEGVKPANDYSNQIRIRGGRNFLWLALTILAVFLDPGKLSWVPAVIEYHGHFTLGFAEALPEGAIAFSFVRELLMLGFAYMAYRTADPEVLKDNGFDFEPIREVAFIFIGIFATMMPALELVANFAASEQGAALIDRNTLYWGTGLLSGILDNAPTYMNFLTAALAAQGGDIQSLQDVVSFAQGGVFDNSVIQLSAISVAAVFFGAMSYIGNGPNFMVKAIAEQNGIEMPSFFGYMLRYSLPILLTLFAVVWLLFIL